MKIGELNHLLPGESSAEAIARYFNEQGVDRKNIHGKDLKPFYSQMNRIDDSALDMNEIGITCPGCDAVNRDLFWAAIVETREHPSLEYVVSQFANQLDIGIQIFHGDSNKEFITSSAIGELIDRGRVHLSSLATNELKPRAYNALLLSRSFWESLYGRKKILIFQTDALLRRNSDYTLVDFMQFDYIGTRWNRQRPVGIVAEGGCGGLSLRDWGLTMECIDRFPPKYWPGGEDGYYAFHLELMGANVAKEQDCAKFSTQSKFPARSFGTHQVLGLVESIKGWLSTTLKHAAKGARRR